MSNAEGSRKKSGTNFVPVSTKDELDQLLAASGEQPVVLFKHDYACSISVRAYHDLAKVPGDIALIDVERDHALSQSLATQLGVRHESPQVIVVRHEAPVYSASHWNISPEDVTNAAGRSDVDGNQGTQATD